MAQATVYVAAWCVMEYCNPTLETLGIFHDVESAFCAVIKKGVDSNLITKERFVDSFYDSPHLQQRMSQRMPYMSSAEFVSCLYVHYFNSQDAMTIEQMNERMDNLFSWCGLKYLEEKCHYNVSAHIL